MGYKVVDRMTAGLGNHLLIFESTATNRMSLAPNAEVGDYLRIINRTAVTPDGYLYDHDGTDDAPTVPDELSLTYILRQPTFADLNSKFNDLSNQQGKHMTLRALDSTTATAKLTSCKGRHLHYADTSTPHVMEVTFTWQLVTDFS